MPERANFGAAADILLKKTTLPSRVRSRNGERGSGLAGPRSPIFHRLACRCRKFATAPVWPFLHLTPRQLQHLHQSG